MKSFIIYYTKEGIVDFDIVDFEDEEDFIKYLEKEGCKIIEHGAIL